MGCSILYRMVAEQFVLYATLAMHRMNSYTFVRVSRRRQIMDSKRENIKRSPNILNIAHYLSILYLHMIAWIISAPWHAQAATGQLPLVNILLNICSFNATIIPHTNSLVKYSMPIVRKDAKYNMQTYCTMQ